MQITSNLLHNQKYVNTQKRDYFLLHFVKDIWHWFIQFDNETKFLILIFWSMFATFFSIYFFYLFIILIYWIWLIFLYIFENMWFEKIAHIIREYFYQFKTIIHIIVGGILFFTIFFKNRYVKYWLGWRILVYKISWIDSSVIYYDLQKLYWSVIRSLLWKQNVIENFDVRLKKSVNSWKKTYIFILQSNLRSLLMKH